MCKQRQNTTHALASCRLHSILQLIIALIIRIIFIVTVGHGARSFRPHMGNQALASFQRLHKIKQKIMALTYCYRTDLRMDLVVFSRSRCRRWYLHINWFYVALLMRHRRLVRHQHGRSAEHVRERIVQQIQMSCRIQICVPHHLRNRK